MEDRGVTESVCMVESGVGAFGSRVNAAPLCSEAIKVKTYPIEKTSNERVQESLVVRDLLLVLQGYEGVYIRYNNSYRRDSMYGPEYKVIKLMNVTFKSFSKRLIKVGSVYVRLNKFQQWSSEDKYGRVMHRFAYEIRRFLFEEYLTCVKELEDRFQRDLKFSIRDLEMVLEESFVYKFRLLDQIADRIVDGMRLRSEMDRVQMDFENFMDDLRRDAGENEIDLQVLYDTRVSLYVKGGSILCILQEMIEEEQGDARNVSFLNSIYGSLKEEYAQMFSSWLEKGELNDEYEEFLISDTVSDSNEEKLTQMLDTERLWETRFVIRKDGLLPQFEEKELQHKILLTGKMWNLIRASVGHMYDSKSAVNSKNRVKNALDLNNGPLLRAYVNEWYLQANQECMRLFNEGYHINKFTHLMHDQFYVNGTVDQVWTAKFLSRALFELTRTLKDFSGTAQKIQRHFQDAVREVSSDLKENDRYKYMMLAKLTSVRLDSSPFFETLRQFTDEEDTSILNADNFQQLKGILVNNTRLSSNLASLDSDRRINQNHSVPTVMYIQFETSVPYPLNVIWTKPVMVQYQMAHRLLMIIAYHERLLEDTWFEVSKNKYWRQPHDFISVVHNESVSNENDTRTHDLRVRCIRLARVIHFQMRCATRQRRSRVAAATRLTDSTSGATLTQLQQGVQDHVTNVVSASGLTSLNDISALEDSMHVTHSFIRFVASWRRKSDGQGLQQHGLTENVTLQQELEPGQDKQEVWTNRLAQLKQYATLWASCPL